MMRAMCAYFVYIEILGFADLRFHYQMSVDQSLSTRGRSHQLSSLTIDILYLYISD